MRSTLQAAILAALIVLAGCSSGTPGIASPTTDTSPAAGTDDGPGAGADVGTLRLYVSDQPNAIDDFRHLNVTISRVGLSQAAGDDDDSDAAETTVATATEVATANGTTTPTETGTGTAAVGDDEKSDESDDGDEADAGDAGWVEYEVDDRTVDLTELRGANASLLGEFPVENGTYTKVFVYVSEVNATLDSGEQVRVKLPSRKLQLTKPFTVGANESVDFVFDIAVHKAGKSGKYILRPVIGESGTDVRIAPVDEVDDRDEENDRDDADDDDRDDGPEHRPGDDSRDEASGSGGLSVAFVGTVTPGENATIEVARNGTPVDNATVSVDDEVVGTTDAAGRLTVVVPAEADEFAVEIEAGDAEAELETELEGDDGSERGTGGSNGDRG